MKSATTFETLQFDFLDQVQNIFSGILEKWDEVLLSAVLLAFGWFLGKLVEKLFIQLSQKKWIQQLSEKSGFSDFLKKAGVKNSFGQVIGEFLKGYIFTLFILSSAKILEISAIAEFLESFLLYIPKLLVAFVIVLFGVQISDTVFSLVSSAFRLLSSPSGTILAGISRGIIITFAVLAALVYLEIAPFLINVLFIGFVGMIAIAGGLAFGLGGKKTVEKFLEEVTHSSTDSDFSGEMENEKTSEKIPEKKSEPI